MSGKRCHRSHGAQPIAANAKNMTAKAKDVYAPDHVRARTQGIALLLGIVANG
jgi:hypothetical protein